MRCLALAALALSDGFSCPARRWGRPDSAGCPVPAWGDASRRPRASPAVGASRESPPLCPAGPRLGSRLGCAPACCNRSWNCEVHKAHIVNSCFFRTPCKIEPSINCVLSTRKPEEREDPLQRVQHQQQDAQAKKEMVMYCKEKVYAGVDEFSFEEIRAEIYRKKARKKDEDEIQAIERKKEEIQRKIEELEQKLKKKEDNKQQQPHEQAAEVMGASTPLGLQGFTFSSTKECGEKQPQSQSEFQVYEDTQLHKPSCSEDVGLLPPPAAVPFFSIFDESTTLTNQNISPIMETSLEDAHSSGASVSGGSLSSVTQTSAMKYLQISEKLELAQSLPAELVTDDDVAQILWSPEERKKLLSSVLSSLAASPGFHLEAGALPHMEVEKDVELGNETYCIKMEYWNNEEYKMFFAIPTGCIFQWDAKGFAIKVYSQPVPWDFYITLELQKRLNSDFDQSFSENCSCYLYQDGCAILHKDTNCFTLRDILHDRKFITKEIIFLVVHDLLHVVEKLHKAEIVHGDLRPEVLFLGDRICDAFSNEEVPNALKVVDFSHSLDLRLLPQVSLPYNFPTAQTPHGQQLLAESSLPYQVDLVGIADIVHLLLFGEHIQVYQENSIWKISQNFSKTPDSDFWSKLFERILNADGKSTVPLLRELREEISEMFDSSFKERLLLTLAAVGETFLLVNFQ
ncbi:mitotic checkpoint serine/threonine-protein kinase BUB1 beta [Pyrgilauda ruficollis]|uniref:mitotic checkpoint serine/threonine-protein kinase BUB1 beta n=1 Tax=Pyrgilauda ruficollis TaxID=221976 RepID=UPI001B8649E8|nr:mitotic checkpoint serine/threonine-protein kinase BUB1 beta [Pyrgilauda ruficollis]